MNEVNFLDLDKIKVEIYPRQISGDDMGVELDLIIGKNTTFISIKY